MRHLIPALVVMVSFLSTAHADPPKASPFSNKSLGEGGGYKHPDADVGKFFETKPVNTAPPKPELPAPSKVTPDIQPAAAISSRPRPRPFAAVRALPVVAPLPAPVVKKEGVDDSGLDSASDDARRDYEARLFGAAPAPRRPGLTDPAFAAKPDFLGSASTGEGMLFVSLELDPKEAGSLRDAVAGLGSAAAFRPDARFQALPGMGGSVRISGWLPASRLGDAIARPGVKRVEVEHGNRPAADRRITGDYLLKIRVGDAAHPQESIAAAVREITAETGFKFDRVYGVEKIPGGGSTALVAGTMPVSLLSRTLGLPGVISIHPALPGVPLEVSEPPATQGSAPGKRAGFLKFVMARGLWLVLLTALLALPTVGGVVKKALAVFVPYR